MWPLHIHSTEPHEYYRVGCTAVTHTHTQYTTPWVLHGRLYSCDTHIHDTSREHVWNYSVHCMCTLGRLFSCDTHDTIIHSQQHNSTYTEAPTSCNFAVGAIQAVDYYYYTTCLILHGHCMWTGSHTTKWLDSCNMWRTTLAYNMSDTDL